MPVILATQEKEIRRIVVRSQLGKTAYEILSLKKTITSSVFKSQSTKKKKKNRGKIP
jgi:hypothetical protein